MNKNILIGILVTIIIALGGYAVLKTATPASVIQIDGSQQPALNQIPQIPPAQPATGSTPTQPKTAQASQNQQPTSTPATNIFSNAAYNFQMNLPAGMTVSQPNPSASGAGWSTNLAYGTPGLHDFGVSTLPCPAPGSYDSASTVTFNGVTFQKIAGSGAYGGMESGSIDASYCASHDGQSYLLDFTDEYDRVDPGVTPPDPTATYQAFDQDVRNLDFAFTD